MRKATFSAPLPLPEDIKRAMPVGMPDAETVKSMQYRGYTIWYIPIPSPPKTLVSGMRYIAPKIFEIKPPADIIIAPKM